MRPFYRDSDNELETANVDLLVEHSFTDYLKILIGLDEVLVIGLPVKEDLANFYQGGVLKRNIYPWQSFIFEPLMEIREVLYSESDIHSSEVPLDLQVAKKEGKVRAIAIDNLTAKNITVQLWRGDVLKSETSTQVGVKHIPHIDFRSDFSYLKEIAFSLNTLAIYRPDDYSFILEALLRSIQGTTLPPERLSYLNDAPASQFNPYDQIYSYYDLALLCISTFRISQGEFSSVVSSFLEEAVAKLLASVNLTTGLCIKELTYVNSLVKPRVLDDLATTALISILLSKYLSVVYTGELELVAFTLYQRLHNILRTKLELETVLPLDREARADVLYHLFIWSKAHGESYAFIQALLLEVSYVQTDQSYTPYRFLKIDLFLKVSYVWHFLAEEDDCLLDSHPDYSLAHWNITSSDLVYYWQGQAVGINSPNLYYTTWAEMIEARIPVWLDSAPNSNYSSIQIFLSILLEKSFRYIPVDEPWFSNSLLRTPGSVINTLLRGIINQYLELAFEVINMYIGLDVNHAYGLSLDRWGAVVNLVRLEGESDLNYSNRVKTVLALQGNNKTQVNQYVNQLKQNSQTKILNTPPPMTIWLEGIETTLTSKADLLEIGNLNNPPGVCYGESGEMFYEFSQELGVISIESFESPEINSMFLLLSDLLLMKVHLKQSTTFLI
jgi:hypothetical protein